MRETVLAAVCACLLISILIPIGLVTLRRLEDAGGRFVDRMVWREPPDSWD